MRCKEFWQENNAAYIRFIGFLILERVHNRVKRTSGVNASIFNTEKSFWNLVNPNQIWVVITLVID